ncbi:MAG TPA: arginine deiminase family protein [Vicinamibacteria bacterium]
MKSCGGHSMAAPLKRVLVCSPKAAGWGGANRGWHELGYFHEPDGKIAGRQHERLVEILQSVGSEVDFLEADEALGLDSVYTHDASFPTDRGMILMHPGKPERRGEPLRHEVFFESIGVPVLGRIEPPGFTEGGDILWLDRDTILIGEGYRTNAAGIDQLRKLVAPMGVEVVAAPLPHGPGPGACLHLMSLMSVLDEKVMLVDLPWLAVSTVREFERRGFHLIPIDFAERESLACNVLALGNRKLVAIEENEGTNSRLSAEGFEVLTFPGSEISANGSGGPTCLTRPFLRG